MDHIWSIRNPDGGATGLEYAKARLAAHEDILAHALPERIDVQVHGESGEPIASADGLAGDLVSPMARVAIRGSTIVQPSARASRHKDRAEIGLLLPCNVVVRRHGEKTLVHALEPGIMAQVPDRPELEPIAAEASERVGRALAALRGATTP